MRFSFREQTGVSLHCLCKNIHRQREKRMDDFIERQRKLYPLSGETGKSFLEETEEIAEVKGKRILTAGNRSDFVYERSDTPEGSKVREDSPRREENNRVFILPLPFGRRKKLDDCSGIILSMEYSNSGSYPTVHWVNRMMHTALRINGPDKNRGKFDQKEKVK